MIILKQSLPKWHNGISKLHIHSNRRLSTPASRSHGCLAPPTVSSIKLWILMRGQLKRPQVAAQCHVVGKKDLCVALFLTPILEKCGWTLFSMKFQTLSKSFVHFILARIYLQTRQHLRWTFWKIKSANWIQ